MNSNFLTAIVGLTCLGVGFFISSLVNSDDEKEAALSPTQPEAIAPATRPQHQAPSASIDVTRSIEELLDLAFAEQSEIQGTRYFMSALDQHNQETAGTFSAYFSKTSFLKRHFHFWRLYFSSWASFNPKAAMTYITNRFDQLALQQEFFFSVLKSWHQNSPEEALAAAGKIFMQDEGTQGELALDHIRELITKDPGKGLEYLVRMSDPEAVMEVAGFQLKSITRKNLTAALEQLASTEGEAKAYLTGQLLSAWSESDPAATANWLVQNGHPPISPGDLQAVAANYVKKDPAAAFEWIGKLPDSLYTEELLLQSASAWAAADPAGIQSWLRDHQPAAEADPVVIAVARNLAKTNPDEALVTATRLIHDPAKNQETLYDLAMTWQQAQPQAFENWLEDTPLIPAEQKQRLLAKEFQGSGQSTPPTSSPAQPLSNGREGR